MVGRRADLKTELTVSARLPPGTIWNDDSRARARQMDLERVTMLDTSTPRMQLVTQVPHDQAISAATIRAFGDLAIAAAQSAPAR